MSLSLFDVLLTPPLGVGGVSRVRGRFRMFGWLRSCCLIGGGGGVGGTSVSSVVSQRVFNALMEDISRAQQKADQGTPLLAAAEVM